jgi:phosphoglucosamine mutase
MRRRHFGTDGVRGVVGETLTDDLVRRLGKAATLWAGAGRALVGRDTRASGPVLEEALCAGVVEAGGIAVVGGVLPTPAVALFADDLGLVVSASHNPPAYNGVKIFQAGGSKLVDEQEAQIEELLGVPGPGGGSIEQAPGLAAAYADLIVERFGSDLSGRRIAVDCANGAFSSIAPAVLERLGAVVTPVAAAPDGGNINVGCGATDLAHLQEVVRAGGHDLGIAFDGDGDRMLAVDEQGDVVDGDQIVAIAALALDVEVVAVTVMTNLGFHRLMDERGVRVVTTDVGDRHVLQALQRERGVLGGEQSGHVIVLDGHVSGDGLAAALVLCRSLEGRCLSDAAAVMQRFPQAIENVPSAHGVPERALAAAAAANDELAGTGRVLVRASGTEPVVRVLAEAESEEEAKRLCGRIAHLVRESRG